MGHRHAIYINVLKGMLMYIACLCPNLVSVHFYAIPIFHFKFYTSNFLFTCCVYRDCYGLSPLKTIYKDFVYFHFQFEVNFTFNDRMCEK